MLPISLGVVLLLATLTKAYVFSRQEKFFLLHKLGEVNPNITWDSTSFLSDLSQEFARCENVNRLGLSTVSQATPDGEKIIALLDNKKGNLTDFVSIHVYIRHIIHHWVLSGQYDGEFKAAEQIGCSYKPGCDGHTVVSCLLSPGSLQIAHEIKGTGTQRAFTQEQYELAESITHKDWDKSNFLENLAAQEAHCAMVVNNRWHFVVTEKVSAEWGMNVIGRYGHVISRGNTEQAIREIIDSFRSLPSETKKIGCSLIPNCKDDVITERVYVLVVCLFN